jgi:hypothetical protein
MPNFQFERLNTIHPFGFITVRVPARWACGHDRIGMWGCWEEGVDNGTLWIDFDTLPLDPNLSPANALVEAAWKTGRFDLLSKDGDEPNMHIARIVHDDEEDGEMLRFHKWHLFRIYPGTFLMVHFSLVLLLEKVEEPAFEALEEIMEREIAAAEIEFDAQAIRRYGNASENGGLSARKPG